MSRPEGNLPPPMGLLGSFLIYLPASAALFFATAYLIPYLSELTGHETVLWWFIVAALGIFLPLLVLAYVLLRAERTKFDRRLWRDRLRFSCPTLADLGWTVGALVLIGVLSVAIMECLEAVLGSVDHSPPFMSFEPLSPGRYWLLAAWFPYWLLNIMGEEILWRGVMLPRQERAFGKRAWLVHGLGWGIFHIAFGWQLLLTLLPIIFVQSYVVQRRRNSWVGVMIHAGLNGPSFLAIAFGALG